MFITDNTGMGLYFPCRKWMDDGDWPPYQQQISCAKKQHDIKPEKYLSMHPPNVYTHTHTARRTPNFLKAPCNS